VNYVKGDFVGLVGRVFKSQEADVLPLPPQDPLSEAVRKSPLSDSLLSNDRSRADPIELIVARCSVARFADSAPIRDGAARRYVVWDKAELSEVIAFEAIC
jgi:hypothetical protein